MNNSERHKEGGREGGVRKREGGREGGDQEKERGEGKKEGGVWEGKPSIAIIHSLGSVGCVCMSAALLGHNYLGGGLRKRDRENEGRKGRGGEEEGKREGGEGSGGKEGGREGREVNN